MSDVKVVLAAGAIWLGCVLAWAVPWWAGCIAGCIALAGQRQNLAIVGALLLGMSVGAAAEMAYVPLPAQTFEGVVEMVTLPDVKTFSERAEVKLPSGERVTMSISPGSGSIRSARAGQLFAVSGAIKPAQGSRWDRSRHVVGRLSVGSISRAGSGAFHWRAAAALQRTVERAAQTFPGRSPALYNGLVTGDDRQQGAGQRAVFRSVGLSHVLAVSGQNVAFVLVILHLMLGSVPGWMRPPLICLGLVVFALVTQLEPSVLRATVTAGIGYWAVASGRRTSGVRLLAVAVGALLLVDPFLAQSIGFQLSVLASLGILVLGPSISARLPGPTWVRVPMAVTLAAQLLVSPLLITSFGSVSLVSIPANVLVGWAVGAVMVWGMSVGLVAGLVGGSVGVVLVGPVRPLLWWIDAVARFAANAPSSEVDANTALIGLSAAVVVVLLPGSLRWVAIATCVGGLLLLGQPARPLVQPLEGGGVLLGDSGVGTVLVLEAGADDRVVGAVVAADSGSIDVIVVLGGNRGMSVIVRELASVVSVGDVIAPPQHTVVGARRVLTDTVIASGAGPISVRVESDKRLTFDLPE